MNTSSSNTFFDLSNHSLKEIPQTVFDRPGVQFLYLADNQIQQIPAEFFSRLPNLCWLDLRRNRINEIPFEIGQHKRLKYLLLDENLITKLPIELGLCKALKALHLAGNQLEYPPASVLEAGCASTLKFLVQNSVGSPEVPYGLQSGLEDRANSNEEQHSQYDLWNTPSKQNSFRSQSSQAQSLATEKSIRKIKAQASSAFLAPDERIKLRIPILPSSENIHGKARLAKAQKIERLKKAAIQKDFEILKKRESDDKWRIRARNDQFLKISRIESGQLRVPRPTALSEEMNSSSANEKLFFKDSGERVIQPSLGGLLGGQGTKSSDEVSDIRERVRQMMDKMEKNITQGDPDSALLRAEDNIKLLREVTSSMNIRNRRRALRQHAYLG